MDLGLTNRVALVAAASRGLGRAIAAELSAEGARVVICGRNSETITRVAAEISDTTGNNVVGIDADVSIPADVTRLVAAANEQFGGVDILVTNAGGPPAGTFETHDESAWENAFRLTLMSAVGLARAVLPGMRDRRWGRILNVTSIAAKQPVDNLMLSNSLRAAVTGFARTLATEVAADGITVNNLLPGYTRTERVNELADVIAVREGVAADEIRARWEREIPMGRLAEPREFAAMAAFLASERASYITGQSIAVDGGWIRSLL